MVSVVIRPRSNLNSPLGSPSFPTQDMEWLCQKGEWIKEMLWHYIPVSELARFLLHGSCWYVVLVTGPYYPPPPVWSVASLDGEPALKPFHINNAIASPENAGTHDWAVQETIRCGLYLLPFVYSTEAKEREAAYQIHCDREGGYIDGIQYTPYAEAEMTVKPGIRPFDLFMHPCHISICCVLTRAGSLFHT